MEKVMHRIPRERVYSTNSDISSDASSDVHLENSIIDNSEYESADEDELNFDEESVVNLDSSNLDSSNLDSSKDSEKTKDDDEDIKNPQYIPKKGNFYYHDDRKDDVDDETEIKQNAKTPGNWKEESGTGKWGHDKYEDFDQVPKSAEELISIYGYDIRNEDAAPRARRRRRYGRGPDKYTRNWEDLDAYSSSRGPRGRSDSRASTRGFGRGRGKISIGDEEEFPSLPGVGDKDRQQKDRSFENNRQSFGDRQQKDRSFENNRQSFGDRQQKDRSFGNDQQNFGDRQQKDRSFENNRQNFGDRQQKDRSFENNRQNFGDRQQKGRSFENNRQNFGDRQQKYKDYENNRQSFGDRQQKDRSFENNRQSFGDRQQKDRSFENNRQNFGDRQQKDKDYENNRQSFGDRQQRDINHEYNRQKFGDRQENFKNYDDRQQNFNKNHESNRQENFNKNYDNRQQNFNKDYESNRQDSGNRRENFNKNYGKKEERDHEPELNKSVVVRRTAPQSANDRQHLSNNRQHPSNDRQYLPTEEKDFDKKLEPRSNQRIQPPPKMQNRESLHRNQPPSVANQFQQSVKTCSEDKIKSQQFSNQNYYNQTNFSDSPNHRLQSEIVNPNTGKNIPNQVQSEIGNRDVSKSESPMRSVETPVVSVATKRYSSQRQKTATDVVPSHPVQENSEVKQQQFYDTNSSEISGFSSKMYENAANTSPIVSVPSQGVSIPTATPQAHFISQFASPTYPQTRLYAPGAQASHLLGNSVGPHTIQGPNVAPHAIQGAISLQRAAASMSGLTPAGNAGVSGATVNPQFIGAENILNFAPQAPSIVATPPIVATQQFASFQTYNPTQQQPPHEIFKPHEIYKQQTHEVYKPLSHEAFEAPGHEVYSNGVMYYDAESQQHYLSRMKNSQKRPKAAIPIVPPPDRHYIEQNRHPPGTLLSEMTRAPLPGTLLSEMTSYQAAMPDVSYPPPGTLLSDITRPPPKPAQILDVSQPPPNINQSNTPKISRQIFRPCSHEFFEKDARRQFSRELSREKSIETLREEVPIDEFSIENTSRAYFSGENIVRANFSKNQFPKVEMYEPNLPEQREATFSMPAIPRNEFYMTDNPNIDYYAHADITKEFSTAQVPITEFSINEIPKEFSVNENSKKDFFTVEIPNDQLVAEEVKIGDTSVTSENSSVYMSPNTSHETDSLVTQSQEIDSPLAYNNQFSLESDSLIQSHQNTPDERDVLTSQSQVSTNESESSPNYWHLCNQSSVLVTQDDQIVAESKSSHNLGNYHNNDSNVLQNRIKDSIESLNFKDVSEDLYDDVIYRSNLDVENLADDLANFKLNEDTLDSSEIFLDAQDETLSENSENQEDEQLEDSLKMKNEKVQTYLSECHSQQTQAQKFLQDTENFIKDYQNEDALIKDETPFSVKEASFMQNTIIRNEEELTFSNITYLEDSIESDNSEEGDSKYSCNVDSNTSFSRNTNENLKNDSSKIIAVSEDSLDYSKLAPVDSMSELLVNNNDSTSVSQDIGSKAVQPNSNTELILTGYNDNVDNNKYSFPGKVQPISVEANIVSIRVPSEDDSISTTANSETSVLVQENNTEIDSVDFEDGSKSVSTIESKTFLLQNDSNTLLLGIENKTGLPEGDIESPSTVCSSTYLLCDGTSSTYLLCDGTLTIGADTPCDGNLTVGADLPCDGNSTIFTTNIDDNSTNIVTANVDQNKDDKNNYNHFQDTLDTFKNEDLCLENLDSESKNDDSESKHDHLEPENNLEFEIVHLEPENNESKNIYLEPENNESKNVHLEPENTLESKNVHLEPENNIKSKNVHLEPENNLDSKNVHLEPENDHLESENDESKKDHSESKNDHLESKNNDDKPKNNLEV